MKLLEQWHQWAARHFAAANAVLLAITILAGMSLIGLRIEADWRGAATTSRANADATPGAAGGLELTINLPHPPGSRQLATLCQRLSGLPEVVTCVPTTLPHTPHGESWARLRMRPQLAESPSERRALLHEVETILRNSGTGFALTGHEALRRDAEHALRRDVLLSALSAAALSALILVARYHATLWLAFGLAYQAAVLLMLTGIARLLYGGFSLLSATLPCLVLGIGVVFIVHVEKDHHDGSGRHRADRECRLAPLAQSAVAIVLGFLVLAVMPVAPARQFGVLGAVGTLLGFATHALFLPAAMRRFPMSMRSRTVAVPLPRSAGRRRMLAGVVLLVCLGLAACIPQVALDRRMAHGRPRSTPAQHLDARLAASRGTDPSPLRIQVRTMTPTAVLEALDVTDAPYRVDATSLHTTPHAAGEPVTVGVGLFPIADPFDAENLGAIAEFARTRLAGIAVEPPMITGDAIVAGQTLDALLRWFRWGTVALLGASAVLLVGARRSLRATAAVLTASALVVTATVGALAIHATAASLFTLAMLPPLVGIGVALCLHIVPARTDTWHGPELAPKFAAITTVIVTNMAASGALMIGLTSGFAAAGRTVVVGLLLLGAILMLALPELAGGKQAD